MIKVWWLLLIYAVVSLLSAFMVDIFLGWPTGSERLLVTLTLLSLLAWYGYWMELKLTSGIPRSELKWIFGLHLATISILALELQRSLLGVYAALGLGVLGSLFMAYVNLRFGAPMLFDYMLPLPYLLLAATSVSVLESSSWTTLASLGLLLYLLLLGVQLWRTIKMGKLARLKGRFS